jgi:hypothetical protein
VSRGARRLTSHRSITITGALNLVRCVPTISASAAQSGPPKIKQPNSMQRFDRNTSKIIEILQKLDKRMFKTPLNIRIKMQHPPTVTPNDFQVKPSYSRPLAVSPRLFFFSRQETDSHRNRAECQLGRLSNNKSDWHAKETDIPKARLFTDLVRTQMISKSYAKRYT